MQDKPQQKLNFLNILMVQEKIELYKTIKTLSFVKKRQKFCLVF
jgi:hypothetical protein